jgi:hypothetical protein
MFGPSNGQTPHFKNQVGQEEAGGVHVSARRFACTSADQSRSEGGRESRTESLPFRGGIGYLRPETAAGRGPVWSRISTFCHAETVQFLAKSRRCRGYLQGCDTPVETGLVGWGIEIRTQIYNDEKRPLKRRSNSGGFRNVWGPETFHVPAAKIATYRYRRHCMPGIASPKRKPARWGVTGRAISIGAGGMGGSRAPIAAINTKLESTPVTLPAIVILLAPLLLPLPPILIANPAETEPPAYKRPGSPGTCLICYCYVDRTTQ